MSERGWSASFTFENPSADVIEARFGGAPTGYEVTLDIPARRRTVWEWLTRKPRHPRRVIYLPNAQLAREGGEEKE